MGFLNDIVNFVRTLFSGEGISRGIVKEIPRPISDVWYRKQVKTGESKKYSRKIFSLTFEQSFEPSREDKLVEEWELQGYGKQEEYGYSRQEHTMMGKDWNFIYPNIKVGAE